jgi:hypothetical protein
VGIPPGNAQAKLCRCPCRPMALQIPEGCTRCRLQIAGNGQSGFRGVALAEGGARMTVRKPCPAPDSGPHVVIWGLCTVSREERRLVIFSCAAHNSVPLLRTYFVYSVQGHMWRSRRTFHRTFSQWGPQLLGTSMTPLQYHTDKKRAGGETVELELLQKSQSGRVVLRPLRMFRTVFQCSS